MEKLNRYIFIFILLLAFKFISYSQENKALSPRNANYSMKVKLDTEKKTIDGQMQLVWRNISTDTITDLQFHLYLNAFKNSESTFMKESGGQLRGIKTSRDDQSWGYCDIIEMKDDIGNDLTGKIKYIHPDDENAKDQSVIRVKLSDSVLPGKEITLNIKFKSTVISFWEKI